MPQRDRVVDPTAVARAAVRWSFGHALPRTVLRRAARQGDLHGRMFVATQSEDPGELVPILAELRSHGGLFRGKYAAVSVDNAVVRELLSHPDVSSGFAVGDGQGRIARLQRGRWPTRRWVR